MTNYGIDKRKDHIYQKGFGWTFVGEEIAKKYNTDVDVFIKRMEDRGDCHCPRASRWYCDMDCPVCKYHKSADDDTMEMGVVSHSERGAHKVYGFCSLDQTTTEAEGETTLADIIQDPSASAEEMIEERELADALREAVESLTQEEYKILHMSFIENKPDSTIAKRLGINARKTLNNRKLRILRKLKEKLEKYF